MHESTDKSWCWEHRLLYMNLNKSKFLNDKLYNMPVNSIDITCVISTYSVESIASFANAMNKLYKLDASRARFTDTISRVIVLHYLLFLIHDSRFLDHLVNLNRRVDLPEFIIVYLAKITPRINSKNNITGFIKGRLSNDHDPTDFSIFLEKVNDDLVKSILADSGFNSLNTPRNVKDIVSTIKYICEGFETDTSSDLFDRVCSFLSDLPLICYRNDMPMWTGFLDTNISDKLGIYRFRNTLDGSFLTNQKSVANLQDGLLNLFCCFLKLYNPVFLDSDGTPLPHSLVPGEAIIDVSDVPDKDAWTFYLSAVISHGKRGFESTDSNSNKLDNSGESKRSYSTFRATSYWAPTLSPSESIQVISHNFLNGEKVDFLMRDPCNVFKRGFPGLLVYEV